MKLAASGSCLAEQSAANIADLPSFEWPPEATADAVALVGQTASAASFLC